MSNSTPQRYQLYLGGEWIDAASGATFESFNPYTARVRARIPRAGADDVDRAVQAAHTAFESGPWPRLSRVAGNAALMPAYAKR